MNKTMYTKPQTQVELISDINPIMQMFEVSPGSSTLPPDPVAPAPERGSYHPLV